MRIYDISQSIAPGIPTGDLPQFSADGVDRVLLRTMRQQDLTRWNPNFTAVAPHASPHNR
ncbi:MAG: hypothetical protein HYX72_00260 [Acidobacteria bacterium]|nr:hypothetical protein [Acidobacteriota bacterium]